MIHERFRRSAILLALAAILPTFAACGDDDDPTDPGDDETIVGVWQATSFNALGSDVIQLGMTLEVDLDSDGTYTITATNDQIGVCPDEETDCTQEGTYSATESAVTFDPGADDETTFQYEVSGSTMTFAGAIEGFPVTATFTRTGD